MTPPTNGCVIPAIENGFVVSGLTKSIYRPNHYVQNGENIEFICVNASLVGQSNTYCINGAWLHDLPRCISKDWLYQLIVIITFKRPLPPTDSITFRGVLDTDPGHALGPGDVRR